MTNFTFPFKYKVFKVDFANKKYAKNHTPKSSSQTSKTAKFQKKMLEQ